MNGLAQDLRCALRQLRKSPGFAAVAILTLALGVGANTLIFSVVRGVLLSPLPFPKPGQLVALHENKPNFEGGALSYLNFRDWEKNNRSFSLMAVSRRTAFSLTGAGEAEQVTGEFISSDFFRVLGVNPALGRTFVSGEDQVGGTPLALISAALWRRKFSAMPEILGGSLTLDSRQYTIIGVIPANFHLQIPGFREADVYVPIGQWSNPLLLNRAAGLGIHGIGRLKQGVTIAQARADMETVTRNLAAAFPESDGGITAKLVPLKQQMVGGVQRFLTVLLAAVGFVLLIACANIGNLLLARSTGRRREFAIRAALGARSGRIIRQLLTESILLAFGGGLVGLLLAAWGIRPALTLLPTALPRAEVVGLDRWVLFYTLGISLLAGILFGLAPALRFSQRCLHDRLKEDARGLTGSHYRMQGGFVVAEIGLAIILLAGAGLTIRSLRSLWSLDPGFDPHNVLTFGLSFPPSMMKANPDAIRNAFREFDAKLSLLPGVEGVSQVWGALPFGPDDEQLFLLEGQARPANENDMNWAIDYIVGPGYLRAMGIPLQRGRFFTPLDNEHSPLVVVVDDVFARKYFAGQDPIGKRIRLNHFTTPAEIVGVVGHVRQWGLDADDRQSLRSELYIPCMQMPDAFVAMAPSGSSVVVRSSQATASLIPALRNMSAEMSSQQVIYGQETLDSLISQSLASRQFAMILLTVFASLALLLAAVGIYGVLSYVVSQRTREIGLRMALGARPFDVLSLILRGGGKLALIGAGVGVVTALCLTRFMASLLYGVGTSDPVTFAAAAGLLLVVALTACYIPARRAAKVNPIVTLRYE